MTPVIPTLTPPTFLIKELAKAAPDRHPPVVSRFAQIILLPVSEAFFLRNSRPNSRSYSPGNNASYPDCLIADMSTDAFKS